MAIVGLFGLFDAFVAAVAADLRGNSRTRPFTRVAFVFVLCEYGGFGPSAWIKIAASLVSGL